MRRESTTPFIVLGAMKCGTTTLHSILESHPDVAIVVEKEHDSFLDAHHAQVTARRIRDSSTAVAGEVSTAYMQQPMYPPAAVTVLDALGSDIRLLAILRDPFERAVSHWRHWRQLGREAAGPEALLDAANPYIAFSSYFRQLEPWIDAFGSEKICCIRLEDYRANPEETLGTVWDFLGVPRLRQPVDGLVHANSGNARLVAPRWTHRVLRSAAYRRVIRPLLPSNVRRTALVGTGGHRRREQLPALDDHAREGFRALVADDLAELRCVYPHLVWPGKPETEAAAGA